MTKSINGIVRLMNAFKNHFQKTSNTMLSLRKRGLIFRCTRYLDIHWINYIILTENDNCKILRNSIRRSNNYYNYIDTNQLLT